ncbi:hypothetical protein CTAYLR_002431 [Chrysophaeum taylorii]|uniref:Coatomer gamma subunit appendage Ig-like subdomain domain-containing protein n=1 Tax=Chrysophaeum taylorii TaxID=2483200 RepID=A0AAD7ULW4_9STRA|nr:hypothetical protein CTAYLR_002431 [Chrysophaeum taylorii]
MRRRVFEEVEVVGFESAHVEGLSAQVGRQHPRLYAGTTEGSLTVYECRRDTDAAASSLSSSLSSSRKGGYELVVAEVLRAAGRDRKAVSQVEVLDSIVVALVDGVPTAYDPQTLRTTATARDVRGCVLFCAHAASRTLVLFQKKKARVFGWQRGGALRDTRRDIALNETATAACCATDEAVVFATRREYVVLRLGATASTSAGGLGGLKTIGSAFSSLGGKEGAPSPEEAPTRRLCEAPGGAGVVVVVSGSQSRPRAPRLLTSSGSRGVLFDATALAAGPLEDRLAWSAAPSATRAASAFFVSLVGPKRCEVHFAPTLALVQTIDLDFRVTAICGGGERRGNTGAGGDFARSTTTETTTTEAEAFVAGDSRCKCLRMVAARQQVAALVDDGAYEDALALCASCDLDRRDVDVGAIEERYAYALYSRGDFEGAVHHWLAANAAPANLAELFPALCPPGLLDLARAQHAGGFLSAASSEEAVASPEKREALRHPPQLRQASLSRAAAAVTRYLEETRRRRPDVDDATLRLVDTMLVSTRLLCAPPRVADVVELLKAPDQKCELESVAPLLAAGGPAYAEPLLWLYRSKGLHSRALSMLVEERCCGPSSSSGSRGAWDPAKFRRWKARYLRSLWFSGDPRLAALALDAAGSLFDVAPSLGLAVFTGARIEVPGDEDDRRNDDDDDGGGGGGDNKNRGRSGGAGTPAQDVVAWMKKLAFSATDETTDDAAPALLLDSGNAVAISYLEFLVSKGERLQLLHNELAYLLLDGLLKARAAENQSEEAYRARLRRFLKTSARYRAETVLSWLPDDLPRERALVLAKLGRHDDVLAVYADDLRDDSLAETYCAEVWEAADAKRTRRLAARGASTAPARADNNNADDRRTNLQNDNDDYDPENDDDDDSAALGVYLCLARRYVSRDTDAGLDKATSVVSRHVSRVDPVAALDLLPEGVAFSRVADFASRLYRLTESGRRTAQIEHQLLRVHYVDLKAELTQQQLRQQSKISAVPELARLGKLKRSLQPVSLSDATNAEPYDVTCVPHVFEAHVALQFRVANNAPGHRLQNVRVKVESLGDADLYAHDAEVPLKLLPYKSTGSCYVVFRTFPTVGTVLTSFANELRFSVLPDHPSTGTTPAAVHPPSPPLPGPHDLAPYLEEIPLQNLELSTADM